MAATASGLPAVAGIGRSWIPRASASSGGGGGGGGSGSDDFEARLARLQRKSRPGKKAELRKSKKEAATMKRVLLPPVPLEEPVSDGLAVQLGFNSYTERLNGSFAALGLSAVLLVELATGGSFITYHDSAVIAIQVYAVLAASALFVKYEKEKRSIWPPTMPTTTNTENS